MIRGLGGATLIGLEVATAPQRGPGLTLLVCVVLHEPANERPDLTGSAGVQFFAKFDKGIPFCLVEPQH